MTLLRMAFRNLFRQKRRNIFLGAAIALGTAFLIIANSFAHGISHTLVNRIISSVSGHVIVNFAHLGKPMSQMLRGGKHWQDSIAQIPGVIKVEENIGILGRLVGNGKSDNAALMGLNLQGPLSPADSAHLNDDFHFVAGHWSDLRDSTVENPFIMSAARAKYINAQVGDILRVRAQDVHGTFVAARLTLVGIFEPSNLFMESVTLLNIKDIVQLINLDPEDSPSLNIVLENPQKEARFVADRIWDMLQSPWVFIEGAWQHQGQSLGTAFYSGYLSDSSSQELLQKRLVGDFDWSRNQVLISAPWAQEHKLAPGDTLFLEYALRFPQADSTEKLRLVVGGLFKPDSSLPPNLILARDDYFYPQLYGALPQIHPLNSVEISPDFAQILSPEWQITPRVSTTEDMTKVQKDISQGKYQGTAVSVNTMYEDASAIMQLESALQLITFQAVILIFFIILIGVINTLRMTIRERTREIGTMRAIGMQSNQVRKIFLLESALLSFLAAIAGVILAMISMFALSQLTIQAAGNPLGMLLINNHLVFVPTLLSITLFVILIVFITVLTSWFPARKAAQLTPATALRHYD